MAPRKKNDAEKLVTVHASPETVVIWKANRPLNDQQFESLKGRLDKLEREQKDPSIKVMLVPHSVDVEVYTGKEEPNGVEGEGEGEGDG